MAEAISGLSEVMEIATLPSVARNDQKGFTTRSFGGRGESLRGQCSLVRISIPLSLSPRRRGAEDI
jgi:hypothetical protein